jgi:hypothetical protein
VRPLAAEAGEPEVGSIPRCRRRLARELAEAGEDASGAEISPSDLQLQGKDQPLIRQGSALLRPIEITIRA